MSIKVPAHKDLNEFFIKKAFITQKLNPYPKKISSPFLEDQLTCKVRSILLLSLFGIPQCAVSPMSFCPPPQIKAKQKKKKKKKI